MSRLIESIRLESGRFHRLHYHQARVDRALQQVVRATKGIDLNSHLSSLDYPKTGLYKCRIVYDAEIHSVEFLQYEAKTPNTLKVVHSSDIEYAHKFEDRSSIHHLFEQRQFCEDILIVKSGLVTDSSYSNIVFFDGTKWVTPDTPLLKGTMRQMLIDAAEIKEQRITVQDIPSFKSFRLINAMLGFNGPEIEVSGIVF
jgi:4-amino-4-deoxychorismate lyase